MNSYMRNIEIENKMYKMETEFIKKDFRLDGVGLV